MELAALEVAIRSTGAAAVQADLRAVEQAGAQANASLTTGAERAAARLAAAYAAGGRDAGAALSSSLVSAAPTLELQGEALAQALVYGLDSQLKLAQEQIKADLAAGLLTPVEAEAAGAAVGRAYNKGAIDAVQASKGLAPGIVAVGTAANTTTRGVRTLTTGLASMAAAQLGVRAGLGSMTSALLTFGLGLTAFQTLGVVAALAAIAYGFRQITKDARDAKQRLKEFNEESDKLAASQRAGTPETLLAEALGAKAILGTLRREAAEARRQADLLGTARDRSRTDWVKWQDAETKARAAETAARVAADRERARSAAYTTAQVEATDKANAALGEEVRTLVSLKEAGKAYAPDLARLSVLHDQLAGIVASKSTPALRAWAQALLDTIAGKGAKAAKDTTREHVQALADLTATGRATATDLAELAAVELGLAAAMTSGTAETRAQAGALRDLIVAAKLAALEPALLQQGGWGIDAQMSKLTPPRGVLQPAPTELPPPPDFEAARLEAIADKFTGGNKGRAIELKAFFDDLAASLDPVNMKLGLLATALQGAGAVFVSFWESVGSGDFGSMGNVIAGFAKQMSAMFAALAMGALAMGLTPPPLGNPAMLSRVAPLLAAAAAFGVIAGVAGGGARGGGGGGGGRQGTVWANTYRDYTVAPRLQPAGASASAASAMRLQPAQALVINQTIIGERDPVAQRQIARMTSEAARRGYATGGVR